MTRTIQPRSYDCIVQNWLDHNIYGHDKRYNDQGRYGNRIFFSGPSIYSYGTHFEMARVLFSGTGKNREAVAILVNGERASVTTSRHQGILRDAIARHMSKIPSVIIPFGALDAANIDMDSVKIIHTLNDRRIPIHHEADRPPRNYRYLSDVPVYRSVDWSDDERVLWWQWYRAKDWQDKLDNLLLRVRQVERRIADGEEHRSWEQPFDIQVDKLRVEIAQHHERGISTNYSGYAHIGQKLEPTGERLTGWVNEYDGGREVRGYHDGLHVRGVGERATVEYPDDDGKWRWVTHRHILGESLIQSNVRAFKRVTCHRCDGDGMTRSVIPQSTRDTWWSYGEKLVTRRNVPVPYSGEYNQRWNLWTTHDEMIYMLPLPRSFYNCTECRGTGKLRTQYMRRNVKFLSGFDHGEPHLAYFFCEMPKCDATTVDEAYEALKPDTVRMAEAMGREVKRQGDIFAVPTTMDTRSLKKIAKRFGRRNGDDARRRASMLLGTNHQGTEVIHANDGTIYARGCLWHVPDGRTNDHVRVKLGKQWHIIVKNTVPVRRSN